MVPMHGVARGLVAGRGARKCVFAGFLLLASLLLGVAHAQSCMVPTVNPPALPNGTYASPYTEVVSATGGVAPYTYALGGGVLPSGLTLNPTTGVLSGIPDQPGNFAFDIDATDATGCTGTSRYAVAIATSTISIAPASLPGGTVGVAYNQNLSASGGIGPYAYVLTGNLPAGLALNAFGVIVGTPTVSGTFNFRISASDANGYTGARTYTLVIAPPTIVITPTALPAGSVGAAYNATLTASGGTAPYAFAVAGALPAGLGLSPTGTLSGTPSAAGTFSFSVTATDANGVAGTQAYTLTIAMANLVITPATLPGGTVGTGYQQTLSASGGVAPYAFAVAGALPAGLGLSTTGTLSGTPSAAGTFGFSVTATDANGATGTQAYTLVIAPPTIIITPATLPGGTVGASYQQTLSASGGTAPYAFAVTGMLPPGLQLDTGGALHGRPSQSGSFNFSVTATDANGATGSQTYALAIGARPDPSNDPDVRGLQTAQGAAVRRFLEDQTVHLGQRLDSLHAGMPDAWRYWVGGSHRSGARDAAIAGSATDFAVTSFSVGVDHPLGSHFVVGAGLGYDRDHTHVGTGGSRSRATARTGMLYASFKPSLPFYFDMTGGHQRISIRLSRYVSASGELIDSVRDGIQNYSTWSGGYQRKGERWQLDAYSRLELAKAKLDGYQEQGDPSVALAYDALSFDTRTRVFGARYKFQRKVAWGTLEPRIRVEFQNDFHDQASAVVRYADSAGSTGYLLSPAAIDGSRTVVELGAVLSTRFVYINLEYRGVFGSQGVRDNMLTLTFEKDK